MAGAIIDLPATDKREEDKNSGALGQRVIGAVSKWWRIALPVGVLLALVIGGIMAVVHEPKYRATAWLKIKSQPQYVMFEKSESDKEAARYIDTQIQLIRSPMVVSPVVAEPEIAALEEIQTQDDPIAWLSEQIAIVQMGDSELFRVSFTSKSPQSAAEVVNAIAESYLNFRLEQETETKRRILTTLEREQNKHLSRIKQIRTNLIALSQQASPSNDLAMASDDADDGSVKKLLAAHMVNASLMKLDVDIRNNNLPDTRRVALTSEEVTAIDKAVAEDPTIITLEQSLLQHEQALQVSTAPLKRPTQHYLYKSLHARIQALTAELASTQRRMKREMSDQILKQRRREKQEEREKLEAEARAIDARVAMLKASIEEQASISDGTSANAMEEELLKAELESTESNQAKISDRVTELQVEARAVDRVQLLQPAQPELIPVENLPLKKMAALSMVGLLLPFGIAIGCESFTGRVFDHQSIGGDLPLQMLGEVTALPTHGRHAEKRFAERLHMYEESVNSLATNIYLGSETLDYNTLTVASAVKHEGKSTLASQIALSLSSAIKLPTLIIDADMRSPSLHSMFDLPDEPGLAEVLQGICSLEEAIIPTSEDGLWLLPAGRLRANPLSLLRNFEELVLKVARQSYTYVVVDTPPVLAASESLVLAKATDATLICALRDVSRENQVREAHRRLVASGANPIGLALNGVPYKSYLRKYGYYQAGYDDLLDGEEVGPLAKADDAEQRVAEGAHSAADPTTEPESES